MANLEKRIGELETATGSQICPLALFITFIPACDGRPDYSLSPSGWYFNAPNSQRVNIMRRPGETDEVLQERAAAAGRAMCDQQASNFGVLLLPIVNDGNANA